MKEKFTSAARDAKAFEEEMQKKFMDRKSPVDARSLVPKGFQDRFQLEKKIDAEIKNELYLLVAGLGLKYELIYDSSDSGAVIYAKSKIEDITTTVKQAMFDLRQKK